MSLSEAAAENEAQCWSEESGYVALKQSRIAVRVSHGWDVPIHSLLESCLSMQLPISTAPGSNLDSITATYITSFIHYVWHVLPDPSLNVIIKS